MNTPSYDHKRLAALRIGGPDAASFLQGQLSCDVTHAREQTVIDGAWLTPAGRVICLVHLLRVGDDFGLFLPLDLAENVATRLLRFRLRARVTLDEARDWTATSTPGAATVLASRPLGRTGQTESYVTETGATDPAWLPARLAAGIAWIDAAASERYTAHQLNLDQLGAVSLDKGCYSGQEIVARTTHRGRVKRRLRHLLLTGDGEPGVGDAVTTPAGEKVGEVVSAAPAVDNQGSELLVLLPVDLTAALCWQEQPLAAPSATTAA